MTADAALASALERDDRAEQAGMHADDRSTCWPCGSWADHAHDVVTGRRMPVADFAARWGHLREAGAGR